MIKLHKISQIEKEYFFEDAEVSVDVKNGAFGTVTDGTFAPSATAAKAVMNVETGDDAGMPEYKIPSGSRIRVGDLEQIKVFEIYGYPLPATYAKGDKLVSKADGALEVNASATAPYFEVKEIIGNKQGALVEIVTA